MLKQQLSQKLLQKLSPQQIQFIKLLEVPAFQMEERVKQELEENPILEEGKKTPDDIDNISIEQYLSNDNAPKYKLYSNNYSSEEQQKGDIPFAIGSTFYEHLEDQLDLQDLASREKKIAKTLIGNIDENGYLLRDLTGIINDLLFQSNIETNTQELKKILDVIKKLDPVGVGAKDLQECLLLQIKYKIENLENSIELKIAKQILLQCFEEFTKKHYDKIALKLQIDIEDVKTGIEEILKLNPKPGLSYSNNIQKPTEYLVPDFIVEIKDGNPVLSLNKKYEPELRISSAYQNILEGFSKTKDKKSYGNKNTITFIKQKLDAAQWFIDAIKQRQDTLLSTMQAIIDYQKDFFLTGNKTKLKPMVLKNIADAANLNISTISRISNNKSVQTDFGIFLLKSFFSVGIKSKSGEEISTRKIKEVLKKCIENENKSKPLSDDKLTLMLKKQSFPIARRTVAKYREQMRIPVARMRKEA